MLKVIIFFVYLNKNKHFVSQLKINCGKHFTSHNQLNKLQACTIYEYYFAVFTIQGMRLKV